jgi:hypothetical protein
MFTVQDEYGRWSVTVPLTSYAEENARARAAISLAKRRAGQGPLVGQLELVDINNENSTMTYRES